MSSEKIFDYSLLKLYQYKDERNKDRWDECNTIYLSIYTNAPEGEGDPEYPEVQFEMKEYGWPPDNFPSPMTILVNKVWFITLISGHCDNENKVIEIYNKEIQLKEPHIANREQLLKHSIDLILKEVKEIQNVTTFFDLYKERKYTHVSPWREVDLPELTSLGNGHYYKPTVLAT